MRENEVRFEEIECDDAEYLFVAYGSCARICQKAVKACTGKRIKAGLLGQLHFSLSYREID